MRIRTILFYLAYTITIFFLFAYTLFPGKTASRILGERINGINPKIQVKLSPLTPVFPLGLKTENSVITLFNQDSVTLDSAVVSPDILTLMGSPRDINFKVAAFNGLARGTISTSTDAEPFPVKLRSEFSGLEIPNIRYRRGIIDLEALFKLNGTVEYTPEKIPAKSPGVGKTLAKLQLTDLKLTILTPLVQALGFTDFNFAHVDLDASMENDSFEITRFSAPGDKLSITLTGTGTLESPMEKTQLNLKGEIRPDPSYVANFAGISSVKMLFQDSKNRGIPFTVSGTVENPIFKL